MVFIFYTTVVSLKAKWFAIFAGQQWMVYNNNEGVT